MSAGPAPIPESRLQAVLGELLHSLSQPLTSLHCALELSIDPAAEQQQKAVSAALEQVDRAIRVVELMRECLEAEPAGASPPPSGITPKPRSRGQRTPEGGRGIPRTQR
jgi:hypothetical protein